MIESDVNVLLDVIDEHLTSLVSLASGSRTLNKEQLMKLKSMSREKIGIMLESYVRAVALDMVPMIVAEVKKESEKPEEEAAAETSGVQVKIRRRRRSRAEIEAEMAAAKAAANGGEDVLTM